MPIQKLTPVVAVDAIEPALPFWEGLGWVKVAEVPHEGRLGFVILVRDGLELMLQTRDSIEADMPGVSAPVTLFAEVSSLEEALAGAKGAVVLVAERVTFYGMREAIVRDPAGTLVIFAEPQKGA